MTLSLTQPGHIVILGAGQTGFAIAAKRRLLGHEGAIALVGEEPYPPDQRPPLSKKHPLGEAERERLFLRPGRFCDEPRIELFPGCQVRLLERRARRRLEAGRSPDPALLADTEFGLRELLQD